LKENKRVVILGVAEQFVIEAFWRNPRTLDDIKKCPQKLLAIVGTKS
jgi:hypothetical protein